MADQEITLVDPDAEPARYWHAVCMGATLTRTSRTEGKKPRETTRDYGSAKEAGRAYSKVVWRKLGDGFVFWRDGRGAAPGEIILSMRLPNLTSAARFDLHPDGRTLALGTMHRGDRRVEIYLVDIATAKKRLVHTEPFAGNEPVFHAIFFDPHRDGLVYTVDGITRWLDLGTGEMKEIAGFEEFVTAHFNHYVVRPSWDGARKRLLVFDAGDLVKVLDGIGQPLLEVCTTSPTTVCLGGTLAPSGRWLALHRVSRGGVYGHQDASHDSANEVEIWDVDERRLVRTVSLEQQVDKIGFDPGERLLIANIYAGQRGPFAVDIDTGEELWSFRSPRRPDRQLTAYTWRYTPDGSVLVVGRDPEIDLYDATTREPAGPRLEPDPNSSFRVEHLVMSQDGALLAAGGDVLTVRRM